MAEVARYFGVKLEENFRVQNSKGEVVDSILHFDDEGLKTREFIAVDDDILPSLLNGDFKIIKLPFKPRKGDYYVYFVLKDGKFTGLETAYWSEDILDLGNFAVGNCFDSTLDALKNKNKVIAKYKGIMQEAMI